MPFSLAAAISCLMFFDELDIFAAFDIALAAFALMLLSLSP